MQKDKYSITQNFLRSDGILSSLFKTGNFSSQDLVLDIGAGKGTITEFLAPRVKKVISLEPDPRLIEGLQKLQGDNIKVVSTPFQSFELPTEPFKVFSNIPFAITSIVIKKLCTDNHFLGGILFVQQEAAEKFGGAQLGVKSTMYSILYEVDYQMEVVHFFDAHDFEPAPHVRVVALSLQRRKETLIGQGRVVQFQDFVAYLFNTPIPGQKPSEMDFEAVQKLFTKYVQEGKTQLFKGWYAKILAEQVKLQKIHRSRTAKNWRRTRNMI